MIVEDDIKALTVPPELKEFIGDYYKALVKRADMDLVGESEYRCFRRFLQMYGSGKYKFATKAMRMLFRYLSLLVYVDENGKAARLKLYPAHIRPASSGWALCGQHRQPVRGTQER